MAQAIIKGSGAGAMKDVVPLHSVERRKRVSQSGAEQDSAAPIAIDPTIELHQMITRLTDERDRLNLQVDQLRLEHESERVEVFEKGREQGLSEVEDQQAEYQKILAENCRLAAMNLSESLDRLEPLAAGLAIAALKKMLGDDVPRQAAVKLLLHNAIKMLAEQKVQRWLVSAEDFPDAQSLEKLGRDLGGDGTVIVTSDTQLASGACVADLELGGIDLGIDTQLEQFGLFCHAIMSEGSS